MDEQAAQAASPDPVPSSTAKGSAPASPPPPPPSAEARQKQSTSPATAPSTKVASSGEKRKSAAAATPTPPPPLLDYREVEKLREGRAYQRYASDLQRVLTTLESTPSSEWNMLSSELSHLSRCFQSHKDVAGLTPLPDPLLFARTIWQVLDAQNVLGVQRKAIEVLQNYTELIIKSPYEVQFRAEQQRDELLLAPASSREATRGLLPRAGSSSNTAAMAASTATDSLPKVNGRGRAQYISPLEKDFPYLCVGILHMLPQSPVQLKPELLLYLEKSFLTLLPASLLMTAAQGFIAAVLHCLEEAESSSLYRSGLRLLRLLRSRLRMVPPVRPAGFGSVTSMSSIPSGAAGAHASFEDEYASLPPLPEKSLGGSQAFFAALWAIVRDVPSMRAPAMHTLRLFILEEMEELRDSANQNNNNNNNGDGGGADGDGGPSIARIERTQRDWLGGGRCSHRLIHSALLRALQDDRERTQRLVLDLMTAFFPLLARHSLPSVVASAGAPVEPDTHISVLSWVLAEEEHTLLVAAALQVLGAPRTSSNVTRRIVAWLAGSSHPATQPAQSLQSPAAPNTRLASVVVPILTHTISRALQWWRLGPVRWLLATRLDADTAARLLDSVPTDDALWAASPLTSHRTRVWSPLSPYECATFEVLFLHTTRSFGVGRHGAGANAAAASAFAPGTPRHGSLFGSSLLQEQMTSREMEAFPAAYVNAVRRLLTHVAPAEVAPEPSLAGAERTVATASTQQMPPPQPGTTSSPTTTSSSSSSSSSDDDEAADGVSDDLDGETREDAQQALNQSQDRGDVTPSPRPAAFTTATPSVAPRRGREALLYHMAPPLVPMLCDVLIVHQAVSEAVASVTAGSASAAPSSTSPPSSAPPSTTTRRSHDGRDSSSAGLVNHAFRELQKVLPWRYFLDYEMQLVRTVQTDTQSLLVEPTAVMLTSWAEPQWSAAMQCVDGGLCRFLRLVQCVQPFAMSPATPGHSTATRSGTATTTTTTAAAGAAAGTSGSGGTKNLVASASAVCEALVETLVMASRAAATVEASLTNSRTEKQPASEPRSARSPTLSALAPLAQRCVAQQVLHGCLDAFQFYYLTTFAGVQMDAAAAAAGSAGAPLVGGMATAVARAEQAETTMLSGLVASLSQVVALFDPAVGAPGLDSPEWLAVLESLTTHFLSTLARCTQWRRSQSPDGAAQEVLIADEDFDWLRALVEHTCTLTMLATTPEAASGVKHAARAEAAIALLLWVTRLTLSAMSGDISAAAPLVLQALPVSLPRFLASTASAYLVRLVAPLWSLLGLYPTVDATVATLLSAAYQLRAARVALDALMVDATSSTLRTTITRTAVLLRAVWKQQAASLLSFSSESGAERSAYTVAIDSAGLFFSGYIALLRYLRARDAASPSVVQPPHHAATQDTDDGTDIVYLDDPLSGLPRRVVVRTLVVDLLLDLAEQPALLFTPLLQSFLLSLDSGAVDGSGSASAAQDSKGRNLPLVLAQSGDRDGDPSCARHHPRYAPLDAEELVHHIKTLIGLPQPVRLVEAALNCAVPESILGSLPSSIDESGQYNNSNGVNLGRMPIQNLFDAIACLLFALTRQSLLTEQFEQARLTSSSVTSSTTRGVVERAADASVPSLDGSVSRVRHRRSAALEALQSLNTLLRLSAVPTARTATSDRFAAVRCWQYTGLHSVTLLHLAAKQHDTAVQAALLEHFVEAVQYVDRSEAGSGSDRPVRPLVRIRQQCVAELSSSSALPAASPTVQNGSITSNSNSNGNNGPADASTGVLEELRRRPPLCLFLARRPLLLLASAELSAEAPNLILTDTDSVSRFEGRLAQWCGCVWELLPFLYGELKPFASQFYAILLRVLWTCQAFDADDDGSNDDAQKQNQDETTKGHARVVTQHIQCLCYRSMRALVCYLVTVSSVLDAEMVTQAKWEKDRQSWLSSSSSMAARGSSNKNGDGDATFSSWLESSGETLWQRGPLLEELRKPTNVAALVRCLGETLLRPGASAVSEYDTLAPTALGAAVTNELGMGIATGGAGTTAPCAFLANVTSATEAEGNLLSQNASALLALFYRHAPRETMHALITEWSAASVAASTARKRAASLHQQQQQLQQHARGRTSSSTRRVSTAGEERLPSPDPIEAVVARLQRWVRPSLSTPTPAATAVAASPLATPAAMRSASALSLVALRLPFLLECVGVSVAQIALAAADALAHAPPTAAAATTSSTQGNTNNNNSNGGGKQQSAASAGATRTAATATDAAVFQFVLALVCGWVSGGGSGAVWRPRESPLGLLADADVVRPCPPDLVDAVLQFGSSVFTNQAVEPRKLQSWIRLLHAVTRSLPSRAARPGTAPPDAKSSATAALTHVDGVYLDKRYSLVLSRLIECVVATGPLHTAAANDPSIVATVQLLTAALPMLVPTPWRSLESHQRVLEGLVSVFQQCLVQALQHGCESPSEAEVASRTRVVLVALRATNAFILAGESAAAMSEPHTGFPVERRIRTTLLQLLTSDAFFRFPRTVLCEWASLWELLSNDRTLHASACTSFSPDTSVTSRLASIVTSFESEGRARAQQIRALAFYTLSLSPAQLNSREFVSFVKEQMQLVVRAYSTTTLPSRKQINDKRVLVAPARALLLLLRVLLLRFNDVQLGSVWPFAMVEAMRAITLFTAIRLEDPPEETSKTTASTPAATPSEAPVALDTAQRLDVAALHLDGLKWLDVVLLTHPERAVFFSWLFCDLSGATPRTLAMRGLRTPQMALRAAGGSGTLSLSEVSKLRAALHPARELFFVPATASVTCSDLPSAASWRQMQPMVVSPLSTTAVVLPTPTERLFQVAHEHLRVFGPSTRHGAARPFLSVPETHYCRRTEPSWCTLALALFIADADAEWGCVSLPAESARRAGAPPSASDASQERPGAWPASWSHTEWATEAARTLRQGEAVDDSAAGQLLLADFTSHDPDTGL